MNTKKGYALILALVLFGGVALGAVTWAAPERAPLGGGAPTVVAYQGEVRVGATPYTGDGYFKFAVVNAAGNTTYWSNDGTSSGGSPPTAAVQRPVSDGLFSVLLGDTTLGGMTQALTADVFSEPDRYLRVWFSTSAGGPFDPLAPDTRIAAVPYALQAERVRGYAGVVVVAHSGGDYTSIQAAIDSITDATDVNPYLVWVAPGVYAEQVTMKPYVHLQGAGKEVTGISSTASSSAWPPDQATLALASDTSLRDLAVGNYGTGVNNAALLASPGIARVLVADVKAVARGSGTNNQAIVLSGSGTGVTLRQVTALAENGSSFNVGLYNFDSAVAVLRGGIFTGRGGEYSRGISNVGAGTRLEAESVTALGENGSLLNQGLGNKDGAAAVVHGGDFTGRGGDQTGGIANSQNATMTAIDVTALAEDGIGNYGLGTYDGALMTVRGATVTARGGTNNYALSNEFNVEMDAENVTALAENGTVANHGLWNVNNAQATVRNSVLTGLGGQQAFGIHNFDNSGFKASGVAALGDGGGEANYGMFNASGSSAILRGGSFTARGGDNAWGIHNVDSNTVLEAEGIVALAENSNTDTYGLLNDNEATATLRGGAFTGRGGMWAKGINNTGVSAILEAESITALGEDGSEANWGLLNQAHAGATLRGGSFTGRGGIEAYGIDNADSSTWLQAESVSALAEGGGDDNRGLHNTSAAQARLRGGFFLASGGTGAQGIRNAGADSSLEADNVTALAEDGGDASIGLYTLGGAAATLRGGSFTGRGGTNALGVYTTDEGTTLIAESVTALAENGSNANMGLYNTISATVTLRDGSFTAHGGTTTWGIQNTVNATLEADSVTVLGENGSSINHGLDNDSSEATLRASTLTARGGGYNYGIRNRGYDATLEGHNLAVLGENSRGYGYNFGLNNVDGAAATLRGGSFIGRGGNSQGIHNDDSATLEAASVTALGESGDYTSYGLFNAGDATANLTQSVLGGTTNSVFQANNGSVTISNSRLVGNPVSGTVTCVLVTRNSIISTDGSTCP